jgi:hypothetical protein
MKIPATLYHVQWLDPQTEPPFVEFQFIYRSKEVLISKGIILPSQTLEILHETGSSPAPKKRKPNNKRKPKKGTPSSEIKARPAKRVKQHLKKDPEEEMAMITPTDADLPSSPLVDMIRRGCSTSPVQGLSSPIDFMTSTFQLEDHQLDIYSEVRALRVPTLSTKKVTVGGSQVSASEPDGNGAIGPCGGGRV